ncbi:O-antigen ligase family protein [uncultured Friedmanniella sp.]|uniref:O-antigen ligase family protein n=1 Tax=uncultured Friedmanniella sp. TaxID=335381 RepID=UPI0035CC9314
MTAGDLRRRWGVDGATVLTCYIWLLLAVPSVMVIAPLGSAGAPSTIVAIGLFLLWAWFELHRSAGSGRHRQPVRLAALGWLLAMVAVYAHAMSSPMAFDEISPADFGMLKLIGFTGVLLTAGDGLSNLARFRVLVGRFVLAAGAIAALGLLQFVTRDLFVDRLQIPGLTSVSGSAGLIDRGGLPRPSGTSTHPIEYGVVLSIVLPLSIVHALWATQRRWLYRAVVGVIALDIFLSSSRSALVCSAVALVVLAVNWRWRLRLQAAAASVVLALAVYLLVPGSLGATTRLFTGAGNDPSIASRTGSYHIVSVFFGHSPILGRGFGTFLPKYWILDNGYLGLLVEGGLVGLAGLLVLVLAGLASARAARTQLPELFDQQLAQGVLASVASGAAGLAFFDTFGFPQSAGCFFIVLGLAAALRRLSRQDAAPLAPDPQPARASAPASESVVGR